VHASVHKSEHACLFAYGSWVFVHVSKQDSERGIVVCTKLRSYVNLVSVDGLKSGPDVITSSALLSLKVIHVIFIPLATQVILAPLLPHTSSS